MSTKYVNETDLIVIREIVKEKLFSRELDTPISCNDIRKHEMIRINAIKYARQNLHSHHR